MVNTKGTVEAEQAESAQTGHALAVEKDKVDRESKQDDPKVPQVEVADLLFDSATQW